MDAATVAVPLPPPEASAVMVASGKMTAPEQLPRWMCPAWAEFGGIPRRLTVTLVLPDVSASVAWPVTPEFC
jgi:hypothetical protein